MAPSISDISALTADDLPGLQADAKHCLRFDSWSLDAVTEAIVALANAEGGVVMIGLADGQTGATLEAAAHRIEPDGRRLVRSRVLDTPDGAVGLIVVNECADPPVLVGPSGAIHALDNGATKAVLGRAALDELLAKREGLRERATRALDAQVERIAFGHGSYYSIAAVFQPLLNERRSIQWARNHQPELAASAMAKRWDLQLDDSAAKGATFELRHEEDETGFITVGSNGAVAAGARAKRPALERFVSAAELAEWVGEFVEVARLVQSGGEGGLGLPALFFEGFRDLRLEGADGYGSPSNKDLERTVLSPRYLHSEPDRDSVVADMLVSLNPVFDADLSAGTVAAYEGPTNGGPSQKTWHGKTLRTERRMAGSRGFGSSR